MMPASLDDGNVQLPVPVVVPPFTIKLVGAHVNFVSSLHFKPRVSLALFLMCPLVTVREFSLFSSSPTFSPPNKSSEASVWIGGGVSGATSLPTGLEAQSSTDGGEQVAADEPRQLLLLKPKQPQCNLRCSALAPDSQWMARPQCRESKARVASQDR